MIGLLILIMARKKTEKVKAKIKNDSKEIGIDTIIKDEDGKEYDWSAKTLEAESDTKLDEDKGVGRAITLRHFLFKPNQEEFKKRIPTAQELLNTHLKQMEIELWKDQWTILPEVEPRLLFYDKFYMPVSESSKRIAFYCFIIAAIPSKGSLLSYKDIPKTLTQITDEARRTQK